MSRVQYKRNVLIVGKTGAGKSTIANIIIGKDEFKVQHSVSSVTRKTKHAKVSIATEDCQYNIKIIDTVGLFDTGIKTNQATIDEIKQYFRDYIPEGISLILFVFKEGRFTPEERATFDFIIKNFDRDISDISALIVTNCDHKSERARKEYIDDIKSNDVTKSIADFVTKGIYAVGFPKLEDIDEEWRPMYEKKIDKDKKQLQDLVHGSSEMRLARELFDDSFWTRCVIL